MPDHDALRVYARPPLQHGDEHHLVIAEAQVCILNTVVARAVQGRDGAIFDASFNQFAVDGGKLLQAARPGLSVIGIPERRESEQREGRRDQAKRPPFGLAGWNPRRARAWYCHCVPPLLACAGR